MTDVWDSGWMGLSDYGGDVEWWFETDLTWWGELREGLVDDWHRLLAVLGLQPWQRGKA